MATSTNYWILTSGRWTEEQLDRVVSTYHRYNGRTFDGRRVIGAGPLPDVLRSSLEVRVLSMVEALEAAGFKVIPDPQEGESE